MWEHFVECMRSRNPETLCPADLGYAAITTVNLGVKSYREGKAFYFDKDTGQVVEADSAWSARWEERSKLRGKPNQVIGWKAGIPARCSSHPATRSSKVIGSTARIPRKTPDHQVSTAFLNQTHLAQVVPPAAGWFFFHRWRTGSYA